MMLWVPACGGAASKSASSPFVATPEQQHNVDKMNGYRALAKAPALTIDGTLSAFATDGSNALADDGVPHEHFKTTGQGIYQHGFCGTGAENQAPDWPASDLDQSIDAILAQMMAEGPGGGHHDNIVNPSLVKVGVGLVVRNGRLWYTTDFSGSCD